ncbi:MAG TPA: hypothetical protein IGS17_19645 [Oscillatoriales cyanobacterium M59_W2019_021]|nr:MAG: hypothetical protein D6728_04100 [Cyanobacteria bacterium J055]HIK33759.1 hypothetical protein [Oscillatoriales cyanobacterium M4454_W2019_049]HIK53110.1 hypothetical protein [Oscillatoriales cyanobacterium M59_W2019_021]
MTAAGALLEQYTMKRPQEVLLVTAEIEGESDTPRELVRDRIVIFKGFSSSLVRSTAYDPDIPVLPEGSVIVEIDRLHSPYDPDNPRYIQRGLTWEMMLPLLAEVGIEWRSNF